MTDMKYYFHTLQWEYLEMAELDMIADYCFQNGISLRISCGSGAQGNILFPFEMNINHQIKGKIRYTHLNKTMINNIMRELDNEVINQLTNSEENEKNSSI